VAVATGSSCAGPPGLEQGAMQLYRSSLAAYPQHQPRRGDVTLAGANRPRRAEVGELFHPLSPVAVATGSSCAGPPGLEQGAMQLYRSSLAAYPQHQPRRGDITLAGADRPRGAEVGEPFHPFLPVAAATGSSCAGPPGLEQVAMQLYRSTLAVYQQHQPRRGDITLAGADPHERK